MLNSLTSFRFFAALLVYAWHVGFLTDYQTGYIGVSFFYVLSGFILAYSYRTRLSFNKTSISSFYVARIAKIYPLHVLTFFLSIPLLIVSDVAASLKIFAAGIIHFFLMQSFVPSDGFVFNFNGVAWSISDELFFYAMFPLILFIFVKSGIGKWKILITILSIWILVTGAMSFHQASVDEWFAYIFPVVRIVDFIVGVGLGLVFVSINNKKQVKVSGGKFSFFEAISIILLILFIIASPLVTQSLRFSLYYLPVMGLIIFVFAFQKGFISKVLSNKLLVFLGEISFGFYMFHNLVLRYLELFNVSKSLSIYLGLIITILISSFVYKYYEEPMRLKIRNGYKKRINEKRIKKSDEERDTVST